jgi:hypothetical protein
MLGPCLHLLELSEKGLLRDEYLVPEARQGLQIIIILVTTSPKGVSKVLWGCCHKVLIKKVSRIDPSFLRNGIKV